MKVQKLTYIFLFILVTFIACSDYHIPQELEGNEQVVEYLVNYEKNVSKFNKQVVNLAKLTEGKNINSSDSLSTVQILKLAKTGGQLMLAMKNIEELTDAQPGIAATLSPDQQKAFAKRCNELEREFGNIDFSKLGMSEADALAFKQKMEENFQKNEAIVDSIHAVSQPVGSELKDFNETDSTVESKNVPKETKVKFFIAFGFAMLLVLAAFIFVIRYIIRIIKSIR